MVYNLRNLILELEKISSSVSLEAGDRGIIVRTPGWTCYLGYPFQVRHLHILLGVSA